MLTIHKIDFFPDFPVDSKVWIYQADRFMTNEEIASAENTLKSFTNSWESHGQKLKADFKILHNLFILFAVDEDIKDASGCSIDKSVHIIKLIGQNLAIDFFNRMNIAYLNDDKIQLSKISDIKKTIESGGIKPESLFFDNLVINKGQLNQNWQKEVKDSWLSRYF